MRLIHLWNSIHAVQTRGSGARSHNQSLREALSAAGAEVLYVDPSGGGEKEPKGSLWPQRAVYRNIKRLLPDPFSAYLRDAYSVAHDFRFLRRLEQLVRAHRPQMIYERYTNYHWSGYATSKRHNLIYFLEVHEPHDSMGVVPRVNFHHYDNLVLNKLAHGADRIVTVSNFLKSFIEKLGVSGEKVLVIPNAVDLTVFREKGVRDEIRRQLRVENRTVIGFVGTMKSYHGHLLVPELLSRITSKSPEVCVLLVGEMQNQHDRERFQAEIEKRGVGQNVRLTGGVPLSEVPGYLEAMDVCFMPDSNEYGSPIKLFEYGALGKCSVFPDYGPVVDVLRHEENGLLFRKRDVGDMANKLLMACRDLELRNRLGERLRQDVVSKHTWRANANRILAAATEEALRKGHTF